MRLEPRPGERLDRGEELTFTFRRKQIRAYAGDTFGSALFASGRRIFSRSFKYHRPRGLLCCSGHCANCMMTVDGEPNVRICVEPVRAGARVKPQNVRWWLGWDLMAVTDKVGGPFTPVGFYYRTMIRPRRAWPLFERFLRGAAGLGRVDQHARPQAPLRHGEPPRRRARDRRRALGRRGRARGADPRRGRPPRRRGPGAGRALGLPRPLARAGDRDLRGEPGAGRARIAARPRPREAHRRRRRRPRAAPALPGKRPDRRHAPGRGEAHDRPLVAPPGPPRRRDRGRRPRARASPAISRPPACRSPASSTSAASARARSRPGDGTGASSPSPSTARRSPATSCSPRARASPPTRSSPRPARGSSTTRSAGSSSRAIFRRGSRPSAPSPARSGERPCPRRPTTAGPKADKCFACVCEDVTDKDMKRALAEGFDSLELAKRYTTVTMGPCQGKLCHLAVHPALRAGDRDGRGGDRDDDRAPALGARLPRAPGRPPARARQADVHPPPPQGARRADDVDGRLASPALLRRSGGRGASRARLARPDRRLDARQAARPRPGRRRLPRAPLPEPLRRPEAGPRPLRRPRHRRRADHGRRHDRAPRRRALLRDHHVDRRRTR